MVRVLHVPFLPPVNGILSPINPFSTSKEYLLLLDVSFKGAFSDNTIWCCVILSISLSGYCSDKYVRISSLVLSSNSFGANPIILGSESIKLPSSLRLYNQISQFSLNPNESLVSSFSSFIVSLLNAGFSSTFLVFTPI